MELVRHPGKSTRQDLILIAGQMLEEGGPEAITLRALGEAAGLSRAAPYRHFANKRALLAALATDVMIELVAALESARKAANGDPRTALGATMKAYLDAALRRPAHYRLVFGSTLTAGQYPDLDAAGARAFSVFLETVTYQQDTGPLGRNVSVVDLAALLWASLHGSVDLYLAGHDDSAKGMADPHRIVQSLLRLLDGATTHSAQSASRRTLQR